MPPLLQHPGPMADTQVLLSCMQQRRLLLGACCSHVSQTRLWLSSMRAGSSAAACPKKHQQRTVFALEIGPGALALLAPNAT